MNAGLGCLLLFMLPFAGVSVVTAVLAVQRALDGKWTEAAFLGVFALVFGLVSTLVIVAALKGRRAGAALEEARSRHPESPWMWRADWAAGKIVDSNRATMYTAWGFAGLWNLISLPAGVLGARQALREESYGKLFVLIFPLVGLGLLVWAVRATIRFRRFGVSRLELATLPAPVGRALRGTVQAPGLGDTIEELRVTLTSVRRVITGSGKNRSTSERILWQEEQRVAGRRQRTAEGMVTSVPIEFPLPDDAEPCDSANPRDQVLWRLTLAADVPGVDYASTFEVPVFRTAESAEPAGIERGGASPPAAPFVQPATSRIAVTRNRRGTEILFPAARNVGASAGLTVFLLLWLGVVWALVHFDAPVIFLVVFGAIALLLLWGTIAAWLGVSRITVGDGSVTVASGLLTAGRERQLRAAEISGVTTKIGMQAGNTPYYELVLVRTDGKRMTVGGGIRDKREAEWLAATIREALGGEGSK